MFRSIMNPSVEVIEWNEYVIFNFGVANLTIVLSYHHLKRKYLSCQQTSLQLDERATKSKNSRMWVNSVKIIHHGYLPFSVHSVGNSTGSFSIGVGLAAASLRESRIEKQYAYHCFLYGDVFVKAIFSDVYCTKH